MKGSFKLNWLFNQFTSMVYIKKHWKTLRNPSSFYIGCILKLFPVFKNLIITLKFKDGKRIKIYDFMSFYIYTEIFIDKCYDIEFNVDNPVIFDVGANTGFFALRMKQLYPNSKVYCFEPYPPCINQLNETIKMNTLSDVHVLPIAVSDQSGKSKLFIHPTNIGGHSIFSENVSKNFVEIEMVTLAEAIKANTQNNKCDLLKLDCEGAEFPIIKSLNLDLSKKFEHIIYEPTYDSYDINELNNYIKSLEYKIEPQQSLYHAFKLLN
ncbi:MAG: hypothetical protein CVU00_03110 [Bacteroidetes bacterium HGW-Bacteroidetes-17]|nr:MAG: hypothetical protein CVU00_03110 [Bacteroidetes bacterium HGW-Bacteroidetes-17]